MWIRPSQLSLGATAPIVPQRALPTDFARWAGESAGSFLGGGLVGYLVQPSFRSALRGGLATSSIRTLGDVVIHRQEYPVWFLTVLSLFGTVSLWALWKGRKS